MSGSASARDPGQASGAPGSGPVSTTQLVAHLLIETLGDPPARGEVDLDDTGRRLGLPPQQVRQILLGLRQRGKLTLDGNDADPTVLTVGLVEDPTVDRRRLRTTRPPRKQRTLPVESARPAQIDEDVLLVLAHLRHLIGSEVATPNLDAHLVSAHGEIDPLATEAVTLRARLHAIAQDVTRLDALLRRR